MSTIVYQAFYRPEQRAFLDPDFAPLDNTANPYPDLAEYYLFMQHYELERFKSAEFTGIVSWSFEKKTRIKGQRFIDFIDSHPGFDVYFVNPAPHHAQRFKNIWWHGEQYHPGIIDYAQKIMDKAGIRIELKEIVNTENNLLFCNYWVGNRRFWREYMEFSLRVYRQIAEATDDNELKAQRDRHSWAKYSGSLSFMPFVFERIFSTLLVVKPDIRVLGYPFTDEHKRTLVELDDLYERLQSINNVLPAAAALSRFKLARSMVSGLLWLAIRAKRAYRWFRGGSA